ncbi:secreted/surface protein with fasciclin-like repeats [Xenococcus sp. PCC 7305]|uniref:fasciclin domain-containing protein n=1 Tax=Xenococcus sp. PCC 7305 TaxID=102125 RepID=UPI0002ABF89F|nr:fasciclin domain-containing protein [Xenococcus sp. PCC 7305]ELS05015.1 secreted/surface protein with fasciclin-like repeats [Xenococcus sp. PCC 7305]
MKTVINTLVLALISLFVSSNVLAQFFYPSSSFFSPAANLNRGSKTNPLQWLETHEVQVFGFLISVNDLGSKLTQNDDPITVLAPTDKAFAKLPKDVRERLSEPGQMARLLKYHLVPQIITDDQLKQGKVNTLEGSELQISGEILPNQNTKVKLNEATAEISIGFNDNLIVIVIDQVLLPPNFN